MNHFDLHQRWQSEIA